MISCTGFRAAFEPATEDPRLLAHIRACDACLGWAAGQDPDILFRALGGEELVPPGGVDAFAADVMREVRLRSKEHAVVHAETPSWKRLAAAAVVSAVAIGGGLFYQHRGAMPAGPLQVKRAVLQPASYAAKPVVDKYESETATIVEVPTAGEGDVQVVMVFDESLPADL
jgi:hypothetical protein